MSGAISSLGIGSGVLTSDIIDQLKEADTSRIVRPIEGKITRNNQEQDAYKLLNSLMKTFKASASALSYDTIFDNKTVNVTGNAEVIIDTGANVDSFSLETVTLAKTEITSFGSFADRESTSITNGVVGTGTLSIGSFSITYDETMTLDDLAQAITDEAGSSVNASILQTGSGAYSLVVSSKTTGVASALNVTDNAGLLDAGLATTTTLQTAEDSEFKYNGLTITRSTNDIKDLVVGMSITLKEEGDISSVKVSQDTSTITGELQLLSDSYNSLMQNISDMTTKNQDTGAEGVFNGESFIKGIRDELNGVLTTMNADNDSLVNYGIDVDRYGKMSFDKAIFEDKLEADPEGLKILFTGSVDAVGNETKGWFQNLDDKIKSYTGYGKLLSNFESDLKEQGTNLSTNYTKAVSSLDARYDIMTQRFIAYDGMISRMNASFASMKMMIESANDNS